MVIGRGPQYNNSRPSLEDPNIANLKNIHIAFHTYDDDLNDDTTLHIFIKNRRAAKLRGDSAFTSVGASSYIANKLAFEEHKLDDLKGPSEFNPYLAFLENATGGNGFGNDSDHEFDIPLRGHVIPLEEVVLPVVNIHILPEGKDRWIFDYTITFTFDNGLAFSARSNVNGVSGIILDQDNHDYAGICIENPHVPLPAAPKPDTAAVLTNAVIEFYTHNDNKNDNTHVNIHVVNRLNTNASTDIAIALDVLPGQEFADPSFHSVELTLSSKNIRLQDMVLPVVNINIVQNDDDRWIFDYRITFFFKDLTVSPAIVYEPFSSTTSGVILDQTHHKHTGAYSGRAFPTFAAPPARMTPLAIDHVFNPKFVPLGYIAQKLDDFINLRQNAPLKRIRLHNTGRFGDPLPETYVDVQSIDANPPAPRTATPNLFHMDTKYNSAPASLGQLFAFAGLGDSYFNDVNSQTIKATVNAGSATPFQIVVEFETDGPEEVIGGGTLSVSGADITSFSITVLLTLDFDEGNNRVDLMSWVDEINKIDDDDDKSNRIGDFIQVRVQAGASDFGGTIQKTMREKIFNRLSTPDNITMVSPRDGLNATANSWFMGGIIQSGNPMAAITLNDKTHPGLYPNTCRLIAARVEGDNLKLNYIGPPSSFVFQQPADWPTANKPNPKFDFSPGTLANIDHIVVLTMENRSFDHMLGYLSLPESMGGLHRSDVDGLKGNEFNLLNGLKCPIFRFKPGETIFSPDPPHDTEPVSLAINGGRMDGFAQSYAGLRGNAMGPNIMGYHTADTIPVYDALARDFAIGQRWFAAHPGPTFCNRFYELTGRLNIDPWGFWEYSNSSPLVPVFTDTIFDHLTKAGVSWKYFESGYCFLRFFDRHTYDSTNIATFGDPVAGFEALARSGNLPSVSYIDPHFIELPPDGNCDGPPADVKEGQKLVRRIVEAVVASPKWDKTLLIITYDEHGGFFDHVPPSTATKVAPELLPTHGVRVPTFVISPWVPSGSVFGRDGQGVVGHGGAGGPGVGTSHAASATPEAAESGSPDEAAADARLIPLFAPVHYDHTSILKTIARRFMSANPPYMGARYAAARDLSGVVTNTARPAQFRPFIAYTLAYGALNLTVPGTVARPNISTLDKTPDQEFRFEDAGGGFFFLRTEHGLYLTVDVPLLANTGPGATLAIKQDVKYPAGGATPRSRDFQRWKLVTGGISIFNRDLFTISSAAFPGKTLQPSGNVIAAGTPIVIADPTPVHVINQLHNPWHVTSPLLGGGGIVVGHP